MSKVSVLVAAYNSQDYLHQCLESLFTQTLKDIQVICVDDASTDETPRLLDYFTERDNRIVVKHLPQNVGQAKARNIALKMSDGEYICMLDSDDWLSSNALESAAKVLDEHPETDCVLFQVEQLYPDGTVRHYPMPPFSVLKGQEAFEASLTWTIHGLYMVRADIHKRFPFDDSSRAYSDDNTTRIHYLHAREVRQCKGVYHYRQHSSSVTHQVNIRRFDYLRANESMKRQMMEAGVEERLLNIYERERWINLIASFMFYFQNKEALSPEGCRYGLQEMRRVWDGIETRRLPLYLRLKPGYMPLRPFWALFRFQEKAYFILRQLLKRNFFHSW